MFCFLFNTDEANTLGIIKKIEKGLTVPPVKYNSILNWIISINKKLNVVFSEIYVDLFLYNKIKLLNIPIKTIIFENTNLNSNFYG